MKPKVKEYIWGYEVVNLENKWITLIKNLLRI